MTSSAEVPTPQEKIETTKYHENIPGTFLREKHFGMFVKHEERFLSEATSYKVKNGLLKKAISNNHQITASYKVKNGHF